MSASTDRVTVRDVRVLAALAHPARLAILHLLLTGTHRTATECADVAGVSPSACSYHLRHLERFGLVARVEPGPAEQVDGRTRRWRAVAAGFDFGELRTTSSPELVAASAAVVVAGLDESVRLAHHYLAHLDSVDDAWQRAAKLSTYVLAVSAEELAQIGDALDALLRPLRQATRTDAPNEARTVHVSFTAFPRTDVG
jgi:DNA-binding transcriptional ArsR family regulator